MPTRQGVGGIGIVVSIPLPSSFAVADVGKALGRAPVMMASRWLAACWRALSHWPRSLGGGSSSSSVAARPGNGAQFGLPLLAKSTELGVSQRWLRRLPP